MMLVPSMTVALMIAATSVITFITGASLVYDRTKFKEPRNVTQLILVCVILCLFATIFQQEIRTAEVSLLALIGLFSLFSAFIGAIAGFTLRTDSNKDPVETSWSAFGEMTNNVLRFFRRIFLKTTGTQFDTLCVLWVGLISLTSGVLTYPKIMRFVSIENMAMMIVVTLFLAGVVGFVFIGMKDFDAKMKRAHIHKLSSADWLMKTVGLTAVAGALLGLVMIPKFDLGFALFAFSLALSGCLLGQLIHDRSLVEENDESSEKSGPWSKKLQNEIGEEETDPVAEEMPYKVDALVEA